MTAKPNLGSTADVDPLFLQAEQLAADFSVFSGEKHSGKRFSTQKVLSVAEQLQGLMDDSAIAARLKTIRKLDVDAYIEQTVLPAQHTRRPGAKAIVATLNGRILNSEEKGPFFSAELELAFPAGPRRIGIIAQERSAANGTWMPEHHELACLALDRFTELSLPIVYLIDTPGADAGEEANSTNQAHSISKMIAESANVDVPTVGIVIGVGYSGGAIPLATANILLSVRDGIFNTIQPHGLQSIARKFNLSWQECAKGVGVSPEELCAQGCLDGIIDYSPMDSEGSQLNLQKAIVSSIEAVERAAVDFVKQTPDLMEHYQRSLARYIEPTDYQRALQNHSAMNLSSTPTAHPNIFGLCYRYMRYLTLRGRIHSVAVGEIGRLSKLTQPQGDLQERLRHEQSKAFDNWLDNPDKLVYEERLAKAWKHFLAKREEVDTERNSLTRFILGEPKENYDKAVHSLLFELSFSLYNRWKNTAVHNFDALIRLLKDEKKCPVTTTWPATSQVTVIDVVQHQELREPFITQCRNVLIFDALYDNVIANLASIAKEAMDHKALSRESVAALLDSSLGSVMKKFGDGKAGGLPATDLQGEQDPQGERDRQSEQDQQGEQTDAGFEPWLRYFLAQGHRGVLLVKVEQWKSIGFPQMNDSLFVILTYYFERLLPAYFESEDSGSFKGAINPFRIGRRKDFWNRLTMGYRDLLIQRLLAGEKKSNRTGPDAMIAALCTEFNELDADKTSANPVEFPGFRQSIEQALEQGIRACGLVTGIGAIDLSDAGVENPAENAGVRRVALAVSNMNFQAGAFDMASAEKFCRLLVEAAKQRLPVVCFISSGGMQTKEGAAALFSMAVVNDRLTRFVRDNELPVVVFGFGDCTGGAQASFVTHPLVQTYYFSGTNMPFAGQMVVPSYLPSTSTLSNYLSVVAGSMDGLVKHPFAPELDVKLRDIDARIPLPDTTVQQVIAQALSSVVPSYPAETTTRHTDPKSLMRPIQKVLVHARGCTAVKLIRKAHESGINVVLVASDPDMKAVPALMLRSSDKLVCLGGNSSDESYLNAQSVLKIAEYENVGALHPGIGFLSETPQFASLCVNNGINFIGPSAHSMMTMGNKSNAIQTVQECRVPVVPGSHGILASVDQAVDIAEEIGYPVLLKAVHGGGGKGIQVVGSREEMFHYYTQISTEARSAFGNGDLYLEKFVTSMRHIEVQLLRDSLGNSRVLGLRDCSVQRNNQKVVEESGSTLLPKELQQKVFDYTLAIADAVDYTGAGTVEFIYDLDANAVYFMEMNTRLQVEHPVTEATSGVDIVKTQFEIAAGASIEQLQPREQGYAIEVRVTAEKIVLDSDGVMQLAPNPGLITHCEMPEREDVEVISIAASDIEVSPFYDSLIAQIICRGSSRDDVIEKLYRYLDSVVIEGIATNIPLLKRILKDETFNKGNYDTNYLPAFMATLDAGALIAETEAAASSASQGLSKEAIRVDDSHELKVFADSAGIFYTASSPADPDFVKPGDIVTSTQTLAVMEAMKMFRQVNLSDFNRADVELYPADKRYRIERVNNTNGQQVSSGDLLFIVSIVED
ncbi:ATP-grasp domain-containing protein [Exilibacterium tricleocarpae]|uniref:ATP-grasp domain-containing protein n=1 Tax=Exilibacterium tricleocarpae TaxID=2591008 RepID=A0A545U5H1_9GAMM|nr:biotin carboxylase N-terminal domain-containing protein [Exilibacterium tricleocarpae]TQV84707.1 ATP-grasp domain-containing protein [Exilibacterium tricleocarpae]